MTATLAAAGPEIVFVLDNLPDWQTLAEGAAGEGREVMVLDGAQDGLAQIAAHLQGHAGMDAIHILSHGRPGQLQLGTLALDEAALSEYSETLAQVGGALGDEGRVLLYGCEAASGQVGQSFVHRFAQLAGAHVAASTSLTGAGFLGGDWELDWRLGCRRADAISVPAWGHVLASLSAGDLVVLGINAIADQVTFATLVDLPAGTVLKFTDKGWDQNSDAFTATSTGDGVVTWTLGTAVSAGAVFVLTLGGSDNNPANALTHVTASNENRSSEIAVSTYTVSEAIIPTGEQIFIYQDADSNPYFIFGLNAAGAGNMGPDHWQTSIGLTLVHSMIPDGAGSQNALTNGVNAVGILTNPGGASDGAKQFDNVAYVGPTSQADRATWLSRITDSANWSGDDIGTITTSVGTTSGSALLLPPPNTTPTATQLTQTVGFTEDNGPVALGDIVITDPDAGDTLTATLTLSNAAAGSLTVGTFGAATSTYMAGSGVWTVSGSLADVNAALASVAFAPAANWDQNLSITTRVRDSANAGPADGSITLNATSVNDAPVAAFPGSIAVTEDVASVLTGFSFSDSDAGAGSVTVTFSVGSGSLFAISGSGVTVGGTASNMTLTGSIANINTFIGGNRVTFQTAPNATANVTLTVAVDDGGNTGSGGAKTDTKTVTLVVSAVNDAPTVANAIADQNATEDAAFNFIVAPNTFADVDGDTLTYTAALSDDSALPSWLSFDSNTLTFNGTPDNGDVGVINVKVTANDGHGGTVSDTFSITVANVNDAPTLSPANSNASYTEGGSAAVLSGSLTLADDDSTTFQGATVTVSDVRAGDVLSVGAPNGFTVNYDSGTGVLTLSGGGSLASLQAALRSVTYFSTSEDPTAGGTDTARQINFTVTDSGGATSTAVTAQVAVTGVNDAPTLSGGPYIWAGTSEDAISSAVTVSTLLGSTTHSDPDSPASGIAITGSSGGGIWQYSTGGVFWTDVGAVSNSAALLLSSTTQLRFFPDGANGSAAGLTFRAWDQSAGTASTNGTRNTADTSTNGGSAAYSTGTAQASLTVSSVNDAPVLTPAGPTLTGLTDSDTNNPGVAVSSFLTGHVADVDASAVQGIALTGLTSGTGTWQYSTNGGASWQNVGAVSDASALLLRSGDRVRFVPDGINGGNVSLTYHAWDQSGATAGQQGTKVDASATGGANPFSAASDTATLTVTAIDDAPVVTASGGSTAFVEGNNVTSTPVVIDNGLTVSDSDSPLLSSATVAISGNFLGSQDVLAFTNVPATMGDIVASYDSGAGILTLTSAAGASALQWQAALRSVTYSNSSDTPSSLDRTITFKVNDGNSDSSGVDRTVTVAATNDAPTVSMPASLTATEDTATAITGISFADVDAGSASVTVTLSVGSGTLSATSGGGVAIGGTASALTLSGSIANINTFIAGGAVQFLAATNSTGNVTLTAGIDDGGNAGGAAQTGSGTATIAITPVNDAPFFSAPASISVTEDVAQALTGISFGDVDAGAGIVNVRFSVAPGSGTLSAASAAGVGVSGSDSPSLALSGTLADINAFIASGAVSFTTASNATVNVALAVEVDDNGNTGTGGSLTTIGTVTLTVTAVNDAPVNSVPGTQNVLRDSALVFSTGNGNALSIADVDVGGGTIRVTLTASNGLLTLGSLSGVSFLVGNGTGDGTMVFEGNLSAINNALVGLSFAPTAGYYGPASVQITTDDLGQSGSGGGQTDTDTILINVTQPAPPPPPPQPPVPPVVDGVPVVTTPGPGGTTVTTIPVVTPTRPDDPGTPHADLADIPLVTTPSGRPIVQVSLPTGVGLQAQGPSHPVSGTAALEELGLSIVRVAGNDPQLTNSGQTFFATLDPSEPLTIQTITATTGAGFNPEVPFIISGSTHTGDGVQAIILDARALTSGTLVQVDNVDFLAVVGAVRIIGGAGQNIASGDGASQWIVLGADDDVIHGGGGSDVVASKGGNDRLYGDDGNDTIVGGIGDDHLEGGAGNDVLQGGMSDAGIWRFALHADGALQVDYGASQRLLTDVHSVSLAGRFSGGETLDGRIALAFADYGQLETISLLFQGLTGELPTLQAMNTFATQGWSRADLLQAAWTWFEGTLPANASVPDKLKALIGQTWGQAQATPQNIQVALDYLAHGGTWAGGLEFLVSHANVRQLITQDGTLQLTQASALGEMGWGAGSGNDTLLGGAGNDVLIGGNGNDVLDGGAGTDMAVFLGTMAQFSVQLRASTASGALAGQQELVLRNALSGEQDILRNVELLQVGGQAYRLELQGLQSGASGEPLAGHVQAMTQQDIVLVGLPSF